MKNSLGKKIPSSKANINWEKSEIKVKNSNEVDKKHN